MAPPAALEHVSHVLTCLVHQHAHFEDEVTPPRLETSAPIPDVVATRVRRLFPEEVTSELARLRRWLPSFADGVHVMWGDVADCLVSAIEALPEDAERPRAQGALFANLVLADTVDAPSVVDSHAFLAAAGLKAEHARLLLDGGSEATLATLVAAGHVTAATEALTAKISETKDWDERLALLSAAARWEWCGDGSAWVGCAANEAAAKTLKLALNEMVKPATHGAQRRPFALALTTILRALARGGGDAASVALLPLDAIVDVASSWSQKGNAAAENSALLQSVVALQARLPEKRTDAALELHAAVHQALASGLQADKDESKVSALECLVEHFGGAAAAVAAGSEAPAYEEIRELLARAASIGGTKGPPPALWGRVERALATGAEANPLCALDVAADMLGGEHAVGVSKEMAKKAAFKVSGSGSPNSRVVALRFLAWAIGEDPASAADALDDERGAPPTPYSKSNAAAAPSPAVVEETWRRSASLAAAVAEALKLPPPSGTWQGPEFVTYAAKSKHPDAPTGVIVEVMLTALKCSPLLLDPRSEGARSGIGADGTDASESSLLAVALACACGTREVETAARRAIRRHARELSPTALRRAVVHSLRSAESAMEGSVDADEWRCRLMTAAVVVQEASRKPTDDVFFDAAAVGPRAAAAVLLATAHPEPAVHAAAAELLAAAEDLVDVAALSGEALGRGADAAEDGENSLVSKLGGGLLRWLSQQSSVGPETHSRAVSMLGGWHDDDRVSGWNGRELSACGDAGVRRAAERLAAAMVVDYAPPSTMGASGGSGGAPPSAHAHAIWRAHVAIFVAAARPKGHRPGNGTVAPTSPVKKMLFAEDRAEDTNAGLERQVGLGDASQFDSEAIVLRAWERCAEAAAEGGGESFSPEAATLARRRSDVMIDALTGIAPPSLPSLMTHVAKEVVSAARLADESLKKTLGSKPGSSKSAAAARATWPALARGAAGLTLLRKLASRALSRKLPDAAPTLELAWEACDAWLSFLPDVAQQGFSNDYGDDGVLTDDDGPAVAMRAVDAVAALATLRFHNAPPADEESASSAVRAFTGCLPRDDDSSEWRGFANTVIETIRVVVGMNVASADSVERAVPRLVEACRAASARAERDAREDAPPPRDDEPTRAGALASVALVKILVRRPSAGPEALAATLLQAAGAARHARDLARRVSPTSPLFSSPPTPRLLEVCHSALASPAATASAGDQSGLLAAAALASLGLSATVPASAASYRALREIAGLWTSEEAVASASAAAAAAARAVSADAVSLATEARRGATFESARAVVSAWGSDRVVSVAEGARELAEALGDASFVGHSRWREASESAEPYERVRGRDALGDRVEAAAGALLWVVEALATSAAAPMDPALAVALARAATEASRLAPRADVGELWTSLGGKVGLGRGFGARNEEAMARSAEATSAVVDELLDVAGDARGDPLPGVATMACLHLLRSSAGAAAATRLAKVASTGTDALRRRAMALVSASLACPVASATHTPWLAQLAAVAVAMRGVSAEARGLLAATLVEPGGSEKTGKDKNKDADANARAIADPADPFTLPTRCVQILAPRYPRGKLAFRRALAEATLRCAEVASEDGLDAYSASVVAASLRLFHAAVAPVVGIGPDEDREKPRDFPTAPLGGYGLRLARLFAFALADARGVPALAAAADACGALAERYARAGHAAAVSVEAAATTRLATSAALASVALPAPRCVAAGVRLAVAAGLTSSTRLKTGVAPAIVAALRSAKGASAPEAAAALFTRVLFFELPTTSTSSSSDDAEEPAAATARDVLDVACGVLSALPDDGTAGSLDELAILACALRAWPSVTAPPDVSAGRAAAGFVRGLGFDSLDEVASKFALLEAGGYMDDREARSRYGGAYSGAAEKAAAASAEAFVKTPAGSARPPPGSAAKGSVASPSALGSPAGSAFASKTKLNLRRSRSRVTLDPVQVAAATSNRRLFFKEVCDALGAAGGTSPAAWAQALRSLAAAAATEEADAQRRAAAADLLAAWIDARVTCEGVGAWETRALAAAASELVALDDPALAPACAALASERATADPAAVVDAVLLGNVVPNADDLTRDDVKTRLPAWIPPEDGEDTTGSHAPGSRRRSAGGKATPAGKAKAAASPVKPPRPSIPLPDSCRDRVRGVSAQDEDRLRRWATTWMRDATRDAESLLANSAASRAVSGDLAPVASRDAYADEAEDEEDAAERAEAARSAEARRDPFEGVVAPVADAFTVPVPTHLSGFSSPFAPKTRARSNAVGTKPPLFSGKGGLAAAILAGRWRHKAGMGGVSPRTSRKERRRARALGVDLDRQGSLSADEREQGALPPMPMDDLVTPAPTARLGLGDDAPPTSRAARHSAPPTAAAAVSTSRDVEGRRARDAREAAAFEAKVREVERVLTPGKGPEEATETSDPGDVMHAADRGEASPAPAATKESEFQKSVSRLKRLSLANRMASRE